MGTGWSRSRSGRFTHGKVTGYPLYRRLGGPQGRSGQARKISPPPGFDPRTVQLVASRYTDRAVPGPKSKLREYLRKTRESKVMHGQYIRSTKWELIDEEDAFLWLSRGYLKGETDSEITSAHDLVLQTKYSETCLNRTPYIPETWTNGK